MKWQDRFIMAISGVGLIGLGVDYIRHRNDPKIEGFECPFCRTVHQCTEQEFVMHVADIQRARQGVR